MQLKRFSNLFAIFLLTLMGYGGNCGSSWAEDFNQASTQNKAAKVNNRGSDDSMEAATDSAMIAIMNAAALNIPGAFSWGYKGYGQYINSEKLDDLEARTLKLRGKMNSVGTSIVKSGGGGGGNGDDRKGSDVSGNTSFSRLDPGFLRKGRSAEISEEFEKQTGMPREEFLGHLSSATDSDLSYDDPNLMQKIEGRYQQFKSRIPNEKFRKGLETAETLVPAPMRNEALGKLAKMYSDAWSDDGKSPAIASEPATPAPAVVAAQPQMVRPGADPNSPGSFNAPASAVSDSSAQDMARKIASTDPNYRVERNVAGMFIGIGGKNAQEALNEFLETPSDNDTIFLKVTKRYRVLTPGLLGQASVIESK